MPRLRRLAIAAEDPAKLAAFYREVFELDRIGDEEEAVFLSDGSFNLALLPARQGRPRGLYGYFNLALLYKRTEEALGLNHFGFHVRSNDEMRVQGGEGRRSGGRKTTRANPLRGISCS
jgi:hypothetical protein